MPIRQQTAPRRLISFTRNTVAFDTVCTWATGRKDVHQLNLKGIRSKNDPVSYSNAFHRPHLTGSCPKSTPRHAELVYSTLRRKFGSLLHSLLLDTHNTRPCHTYEKGEALGGGVQSSLKEIMQKIATPCTAKPMLHKRTDNEITMSISYQLCITASGTHAPSARS